MGSSPTPGTSEGLLINNFVASGAGGRVKVFMKNQAFSKIWILVIVMVTIIGGISVHEFWQPEQPFIKIISPLGGEEWISGDTYQITWDSSGVEKVDISLCGLVPRCPCCNCSPGIVKGISASAGKYSWTIPSGTSFGENYRVRIKDSQGEGFTNCPMDESSGYFSINASTKWKTYQNDEYGFEVRYPKEFNIKEEKSEFISFEKKDKYWMGIELKDRKNKTIEEWMSSDADYRREFPYNKEKEITIEGIKTWIVLEPVTMGEDYFRSFLPKGDSMIIFEYNPGFIEYESEDFFQAVGDFNQILSTFRFLE